MGRKLKYRDVVGGKSGKGGMKNNKKGKNNNQKPRKTYSLYKNDNNKPKRKHFSEHNDLNAKKPKIEEPPTVPESSSESEEEIEDPMKQLRATFSNITDKKSKAIESSDESDIEEENEHEETNENLDDKGELEESDIEEENEREETNESLDDKGELEEEEESDIEAVESKKVEGEYHKDANNISKKKDQISDENKAEHEDDLKEDELNLDIEEINDPKDPFDKHLFHDLHENLIAGLQLPKVPMKNSLENWQTLGNLHVQIPLCDNIPVEESSEFSIAEKKSFAPLGEIPTLLNTNSPSEIFIKSQIVPNLPKANKSLPENSKNTLFTDLQKELFSIVNNYQDLLYTERTFDNAEEIKYVYCLHAVNHIMKTRLKVIHHNVRLNKKDDVPEEFRDQGLVRPKILIVLPFKDAAYKVVCNIIDILIPEDKGMVQNKLRFIEDYTGNELILPKKNPKPEDYEKTFGGNSSDDFKIGLTVTKKSIKLYSDFYASDIIIASPLGLRTIIGAEGEPERDYDFLASIELLILDQTELFLMQNWDHVIHLFNHLHLQPKDSHGTDFSRVRTWSLNGWAKYYRQTLIFSSIIVPEINSIFNKRCVNYAGKIKTANKTEFGTISQVFLQLPHVFQKFDSKDAVSAIEDRFNFFINKIVPQQRDSLMKQTLIFIPNYFDYVRIRNYFKREDIGFTQICEYSKEGKVARARDMFFHGDAHFMLYTERYHYFNRIRVKGIRHIVFYQPPIFPHFYYEMCNLMQEANMNRKVGNMSNMTVNVIYSKFDVYQLASIVGTDRAAKMVQSERKVQMMLTGAD